MKSVRVAALRAKRRLVNSTSCALSAILPYRPMAGGKQLLDHEYSTGVWDSLRALEEVPRYGVIVGYCHHLRPGGAILEIGCGEGVMQERLDPAQYARYLGIDVSVEAIRRSQAKLTDQVGFIAADAATFVPERLYDLIVFNECLEYFGEPVALLRRYERFLEREGLLIVSMFAGIDTARTSHIWRMLRPYYREVAATRIINSSGYAWTIRVLAPADNSR